MEEPIRIVTSDEPHSDADVKGKINRHFISPSDYDYLVNTLHLSNAHKNGLSGLVQLRDLMSTTNPNVVTHTAIMGILDYLIEKESR